MEEEGEVIEIKGSTFIHALNCVNKPEFETIELNGTEIEIAIYKDKIEIWKDYESFNSQTNLLASIKY